uniref:Uncharacterized protein n=2 Tax=Nothobranchius pienaari TaxID=704102 RepID=A0A1A8LL82_9TELE
MSVSVTANSGIQDVLSRPSTFSVVVLQWRQAQEGRQTAFSQRHSPAPIEGPPRRKERIKWFFPGSPTCMIHLEKLQMEATRQKSTQTPKIRQMTHFDPWRKYFHQAHLLTDSSALSCSHLMRSSIFQMMELLTLSPVLRPPNRGGPFQPPVSRMSPSHHPRWNLDEPVSPESRFSTQFPLHNVKPRNLLPERGRVKNPWAGWVRSV